MRSKKGQAVSSFLGDKLPTSFVHGSSEISTVTERSHIAVSSFLGDNLTTSFIYGSLEISTVKGLSHIANVHLKII